MMLAAAAQHLDDLEDEFVVVTDGEEEGGEGEGETTGHEIALESKPFLLPERQGEQVHAQDFVNWPVVQQFEREEEETYDGGEEVVSGGADVGWLETGQTEEQHPQQPNYHRPQQYCEQPQVSRERYQPYQCQQQQRREDQCQETEQQRARLISDHHYRPPQSVLPPQRYQGQQQRQQHVQYQHQQQNHPPPKQTWQFNCDRAKQHPQSQQRSYMIMQQQQHQHRQQQHHQHQQHPQQQQHQQQQQQQHQQLQQSERQQQKQRSSPHWQYQQQQLRKRQAHSAHCSTAFEKHATAREVAPAPVRYCSQPHPQRQQTSGSASASGMARSMCNTNRSARPVLQQKTIAVGPQEMTFRVASVLFGLYECECCEHSEWLPGDDEHVSQVSSLRLNVDGYAYLTIVPTDTRTALRTIKVLLSSEATQIQLDTSADGRPFVLLDVTDQCAARMIAALEDPVIRQHDLFDPYSQDLEKRSVTIKLHELSHLFNYQRVEAFLRRLATQRPANFHHPPPPNRSADCGTRVVNYDVAEYDTGGGSHIHSNEQFAEQCADLDDAVLDAELVQEEVVVQTTALDHQVETDWHHPPSTSSVPTFVDDFGHALLPSASVSSEFPVPVLGTQCTAAETGQQPVPPVPTTIYSSTTKPKPVPVVAASKNVSSSCARVRLPVAEQPANGAHSSNNRPALVVAAGKNVSSSCARVRLPVAAQPANGAHSSNYRPALAAAAVPVVEARKTDEKQLSGLRNNNDNSGRGNGVRGGGGGGTGNGSAPKFGRLIDLAGVSVATTTVGYRRVSGPGLPAHLPIIKPIIPIVDPSPIAIPLRSAGSRSRRNNSRRSGFVPGSGSTNATTAASNKKQLGSSTTCAAAAAEAKAAADAIMRPIASVPVQCQSRRSLPTVSTASSATQHTKSRVNSILAELKRHHSSEPIDLISDDSESDRETTTTSTTKGIQRQVPVQSGSGSTEQLLAYPATSDSMSCAVILRNDLPTLDCKKYINDAIIDFYLLYLLHEVVPEENRERFHIYPTAFWHRFVNLRATDQGLSPVPKKVTKKSVSRGIVDRYCHVRKWTKKVDIFNKDFLVIPVCEKSHWYLVFVVRPIFALVNESKSPFFIQRDQLHSCHIIVLDSLRTASKNCYDSVRWLRDYLAMEWQDKRSSDRLQWTFDTQRAKGVYPNQLPQQRNLYDCGLFVLEYARVLMTDPPEDSKTVGRIRSNFSAVYPTYSVRNKRHQLKQLIKEKCDDSLQPTTEENCEDGLPKEDLPTEQNCRDSLSNEIDYDQNNKSSSKCDEEDQSCEGEVSGGGTDSGTMPDKSIVVSLQKMAEATPTDDELKQATVNDAEMKIDGSSMVFFEL